MGSMVCRKTRSFPSAFRLLWMYC